MAVAAFRAIRELFGHLRASPQADGELLTRYRLHRDPDAFGSLVRRHGPMVWGVCRRVLRDTHAAEDAFQATFLVLAQKADAVYPPEQLGAWLYGVAYRTALKARGRAWRQQRTERHYATENLARQVLHNDSAELQQLLDEQLLALPAKYREPLRLCALQGLNKAQIAAQLGVPEGTVSSRLARARQMLRQRLERRGVAVPAAVFATLLSAEGLSAAVPGTLTAQTITAARGGTLVGPAVQLLAHEVIRSMTLLKLQSWGVVALVVALSGGGAGLYALAADEKKPQPPGDKPAVKPEKPGSKPAPAEGEKPAQPTVRKSGGKVASVDAKAHTLMLAIKSDAGIVERLVKVAPDAKITIDGKKATLADVPKNSTAALLLSTEKEGQWPIATEVRITGSTVSGIVAQVSGHTIVLEGEKNPRSFALAANAQVTVNGQPAKLADIAAGSKATITLTADESAALIVVAGHRPAEATGEKPSAKNKFAGPITAVDVAARTITLATKGEGGQGVTVKLTANAKIVVDGQAAQLDAVPKGAWASFVLASAKDGQLREASEVVVHGPTINGTIQQIDRGTITIRTEKNDRVIQLWPTTKVISNGQEAKITDLKTGSRVQVTLSVNETGVVLITAGNKNADGDKPKPSSGDKPKPNPGDKPKPTDKPNKDQEKPNKDQENKDQEDE
ncbi:MAG: sigma-70 family RNA polymerase sigma factor [Gemmataceae bacterium]|nr:sigma-70 family RNA polymerase sigma factor [Gemmata sp.]MDW8199494.1 sigma-70 family RNA polymerase sigma factor [Gemmataceae bacterium]